MAKKLLKIEIKTHKRLATQDRRWPITVWLTNDEKGLKETKNWIDQFYVNWHPIADHPRRLHELPTDPIYRLRFREKLCKHISELVNINDRILFLQPYHYSEEDLIKLDDFCKKNSLKYIERENSPYYVGTKLIIVYEDDSWVEEKVTELLRDIDDTWSRTRPAVILVGDVDTCTLPGVEPRM